MARGFIYSQLFIQPTYPTTSFAGQTVIVTGSNTGLGKEAARHIARLGPSKLILAVRNVKTGEEAKEDIVATTKCEPSSIEVWKLDLSSYDSVKAFAARAQKDLKRIDVLLENAGVASQQKKFAEGHELTITVNVISTFLLALLLLPKLKSTAKDFGVKPRLVIVSSEVHGWSKFPERNSDQIFKTLSDKDTCNMEERYPTSKLVEVLVVRQIAPKLEGSGVILNMLNPGFCHSELTRELNTWGMFFFKLLLARTQEVGGRTLVASAAAGEESHGKYMSDGIVLEGNVSKFVTSDEGGKVGKKVWAELKEILENVQPGLTQGL